jgi:hypothetical protein
MEHFSTREPGLDGRHRDQDRRISEKHGNTTVDALRRTYDDNFASDIRSDAKLSTVLQRAGADSLSHYLKDNK